ncbi:MAG: hypothetical protein HQ512_00140 [Rhodospirillales bacterium]|nr:hypothetical protein [Rhodospirillales bacterium]
MIRLVLKMSLLAFFFAVLLPQPGGNLGPGPAAADLMQCMESCIKHEGGNSAANKTTCKSRCANIPSSTGGPKQQQDSGSCMSAFKDCKETCGKNKKCARICKKALMRCN